MENINISKKIKIYIIIFVQLNMEIRTWPFKVVKDYSGNATKKVYISVIYMEVIAIDI